MVNVMNILDFYKGKNVLITGHTGFKGAWLTRILLMAGANVTGYSQPTPTSPGLFEICGNQNDIDSIIGDIRDLEHFKKVMRHAKPEIVFHLAAQPIVRDSYRDPLLTFQTNVMGTVNLFESIRTVNTVGSVVNITTDKVYKNNEWLWGYREIDPLGGHDPYSSSKACSEIVTASYRLSFFSENNDIAVSSARAGNVIGGGDFANDRIIPDCVRSVISNTEMIIRNPLSTRPYQHVLESLSGYLSLAQKQCNDSRLAGEYNFGPSDADCVTTESLVNIFYKNWGSGFSFRIENDGGPHEANFLKLDSTRAKMVLGWNPVLSINDAVKYTVEWTKCYLQGENVRSCMEKQIYSVFGGL